MKYERLTTKDNTHRPYPLDCFSCYNKNCNRCELNIRMLERLAELEDKIENEILEERETCKNITKCHPVDEFICSECGLILQDYCKKRLDEDGDEYFFEFEIKYCPCCGAKVVEE